MSERCLLPLGYEEFVTFTRNRDGRLTVHWPENARGTVIARELLDQMVGQLNERRWTPVTERLPEERQKVLAYSYRLHGGSEPGSVCVFDNGTFHGIDWLGAVTATHWMPLPAPPEVTP